MWGLFAVRSLSALEGISSSAMKSLLIVVCALIGISPATGCHRLVIFLALCFSRFALQVKDWGGGGCNPKKPKTTVNLKFGTGFFSVFFFSVFPFLPILTGLTSSD